MYDLETYELTFEEKICGSCLKVKEVEQRADGKHFAVVFNDDGLFYLRTFGKVSRNEVQIKN